MRVFDRPISAKEIEAIYKTAEGYATKSDLLVQNQTTAITDGLVARYTFDAQD